MNKGEGGNLNCLQMQLKEGKKEAKTKLRLENTLTNLVMSAN